MFAVSVSELELSPTSSAQVYTLTDEEGFRFSMNVLFMPFCFFLFCGCGYFSLLREASSFARFEKLKPTAELTEKNIDVFA